MDEGFPSMPIKTRRPKKNGKPQSKLELSPDGPDRAGSTVLAESANIKLALSMENETVA